MPDAEAHREFLRLLVQQQDGKNLVVDRSLHRLGDTAHQLVEIQSGSKLLAYFKEQGEEFGQLHRSRWHSGFFCHGCRAPTRPVTKVKTGAHNTNASSCL